ncbi:MAG: divalent-cation tolerance protein CutA [Candidatus Omnitrophica bacterium]|nr:divalent-cation tolerance protein CutA [Candidatus Omnitrophota bacterium]
MGYIIVFITTSTFEEADLIASHLVNEKIAACTNIISNIQSVFRWKGKVERAREYLLIVKSKKNLLKELIKIVKNLHSYEVPEIIAIQAVGGNRDFLNWIEKSVKTL